MSVQGGGKGGCRGGGGNIKLAADPKGWSVFTALTRANTGESIAEALRYLLQTKGHDFPAYGVDTWTREFTIVQGKTELHQASYLSTPREQILPVWNRRHRSPPYLWILCPRWMDLIDGYSWEYWRLTSQDSPTSTGVFAITKGFITVEGLLYDAGVVQLSGSGPTTGGYGYIGVPYNKPVIAAPSISWRS